MVKPTFATPKQSIVSFSKKTVIRPKSTAASRQHVDKNLSDGSSFTEGMATIGLKADSKPISYEAVPAPTSLKAQAALELAPTISYTISCDYAPAATSPWPKATPTPTTAPSSEKNALLAIRPN